MSDCLAADVQADFIAGFGPRHAPAGEAIARALAAPTGFAATPFTAAPAPSGPRHFSPAAPGHKATAGWDPLDPAGGGADTLVDAAREAGYAEGYATALAEAQAVADAGAADAARDRTLLADLGDALAARVDREAIGERLRATVLAMVEQLVGEVGIAPDLLARRIEAATEMLAEPTESALLRVHPDDVLLVDGRLPATVFAVGDPHVARGSFVLESASTVVEDGPALWMQQLGAAIERVPLPSC